MAIPKIGERTAIQAAPPSIAGIATVALLLRNDGIESCHVERKRNISRKGGLLRSVCYGQIKSAGFAFPGDSSVAPQNDNKRITVDFKKSFIFFYACAHA